MTRNRTAQKIARRTGLLAAAASLALAVAPAAGIAKSPVRFGSKLNPTVQPSNSLPGLNCGIGPSSMFHPCTMVQNEAYGRPDGGELAPRTGTIRRIRLIAGGPGTMRLQVVKVKRSTLSSTKEAKLVANGPKIAFQGQTEANWEEDRYRVESFKVHVPVRKGQQLAIHTNETSMIRCSSGGDNTLIYPDVYYPKHPFNAASDTDGCWLLMEAVIK